MYVLSSDKSIEKPSQLQCNLVSIHPGGIFKVTRVITSHHLVKFLCNFCFIITKRIPILKTVW